MTRVCTAATAPNDRKRVTPSAMTTSPVTPMPKSTDGDVEWLSGSAPRKLFTGPRKDFWGLALDAEHGHRWAVSDGATGIQLTYSEFATLAGRLALGIRTATGAAHPVVAVCRSRGAGLVVCAWASLLAAGVYVPVNPTLPPDRKRFIFENTKSHVVLTEPGVAEGLSSDAVPDDLIIVPLDATHAPLSGLDLSSLPTAVREVYTALESHAPKAQSTDYAYFIHTSGSTGQPKCVVHNRGSVDWHTHATLLGSGLCRRDDVVLQAADCSFDLHVRDMFCFLSFGGHVVTMPQQVLLVAAPPPPRAVQATTPHQGGFLGNRVS